MNAWVRPTFTSIRWAPLGVATCAGAGLLALARIGSGMPPGGPVAAVLLAVVIAAAAYAVGDQAGELLEPLPTPGPRRLARRVSLAAGPALVGLGATAGVGRALYGSAWSAPGAPALIVLAACAACGAIAAHRHADAPAIAVLGWVTAGLALSELGAPRGVAFPWWI